MDITETVLVVVVVILTALLVVFGYHVTLVVFDVRRALKKINEILDDTILGGGMVKTEKLRSLIEIFKKTKK